VPVNETSDYDRAAKLSKDILRMFRATDDRATAVLALSHSIAFLLAARELRNRDEAVEQTFSAIRDLVEMKREDSAETRHRAPPLEHTKGPDCKACQCEEITAERVALTIATVPLSNDDRMGVIKRLAVSAICGMYEPEDRAVTVAAFIKGCLMGVSEVSQDEFDEASATKH
jgi:hypothetical protein